MFSRYSRLDGQNLAQNWGFGGSHGGTYRLQRAEDTPGTDMYHHAKFHAYLCQGC